ncbi:transposase [Streptomyces monashensis]
MLRAPGSALPIAWVTADAAYGQVRGFRRALEDATRRVISGVQHDRTSRLPGRHRPAAASCSTASPEVDHGHHGDVVSGSGRTAVQHYRPQGSAGLQRGQDRVRPARPGALWCDSAVSGP